MAAAGGTVDDEADAAFRQALALDPSWPPARFYLALRLSQQGEFAGARDAWSALIAASPADAPWMAISQAALADATAKLGGEAQAVVGGSRGPSAADVAAAESLSEGDRDQMIEGMVSQLAARLQSAPNDLEGWTRLIRSYTVLKDPARAAAALRDARAVFPAGSAEGMELEVLARSLGLPETGGGTAP